MSEKNESTTGKVAKSRPPKSVCASEKKWGKQVMDLGFCIVPSLIFKAQERLGLTATQLAVLMHLCDFWWEHDRKPHPGKENLAKRLGLSERQVQRHIAELEKASLVKRIERYHPVHRSRMTNAYDLSGLVARLGKLAPDFHKVKEDAKIEYRAVERPRYKPKHKG